MRALVFDCETTGLITNSGIALEKQPRLIEFYGCVVEESATPIDELAFLCNPEVKLDKEITRITGITDSMLADKTIFRDMIPLLQDFFFGSDAVVAHNLSYDYGIINQELQRAGVRPELFWPEIKICTVEATEYLRGFRLSLADLYQHLFQIGFAGAHRAKQDTEATVKCYLELRRLGIV